MKIIQVSATFVLLLFSTTLFAAKQDKQLICHVGNEYGPGGEAYLDDPGCVPAEENGNFCPDAGKIDLIEVANAAQHLNNPSHKFEYAPGEFISDYLPEDIGASGVGNEDTVGDGVDDGCRRPEPVCPCSASWANSIQEWNTYIQSPSTPSFLVGTTLPGAFSFSTFPPQNQLAKCTFSEFADSNSDFASITFKVNGPTSPFPNRCDASISGLVGGVLLPSPPEKSFISNNLTTEQTAACVAKLQSMCQ